MTALSSSPLLLRRIFRPPVLRSFFSFTKSLQTSPFHNLLPSVPSFTSHSLSSFCSLSISYSPSLNSLSELNSITQNTVNEDDDEGFESESESEGEGEGEGSDVEEGRDVVSEPRIQSNFLASSRSMTYNEMVSKLPSLTVKEKKELASYAHSLGKKLKSQQVGKSGVTDAVAVALIETLESKELLKLKIHGSCPGELDDVVKQLESATGSVVVGRIGRTIILYRPSLTKFEAEEKKKLNQQIYAKKQLAWRSAQQNRRAAVPRESGSPSRGRGRRGSSRHTSLAVPCFCLLVNLINIRRFI